MYFACEFHEFAKNGFYLVFLIFKSAIIKTDLKFKFTLAVFIKRYFVIDIR